MEAAEYRWTITRDRLDEGKNSRVGTVGPHNADETLTTNPARWAAYDDDGECYYEGYLYGDFDGFEPLDDFCGPDSGCTAIKINGEWL
jgi:hypothetical protein